MITTKWLGTPFPWFQSGTPLPVPAVNVGSSADMLARLVSQITKGWTAIKAPNRDIVLGGIADSLAWAYQLLKYVTAQTRLLTSTDFMLDLFGYDSLGMRITRRRFQPDPSFRATIQKEIFRERNTRRGILQAVLDLTGPPVSIFEPANVQDSGGFGIMFGFNAVGGWGSSSLPHTFFISCPNPSGTGVPYESGFNNSWGGFGGGLFAFANVTAVNGLVTELDILNAIDGVRPAGVTCLVNVGNPAPWAPAKPAVSAPVIPAPKSIYIDE